MNIMVYWMGELTFIVRISKQLFLFLGNRKILCHCISTFRVTGFSNWDIFHFSVEFGHDCYWNYLPYLQISEFCLKFSSAENVILLITIVHHLELWSKIYWLLMQGYGLLSANRQKERESPAKNVWFSFVISGEMSTYSQLNWWNQAKLTRK